MSTAPDSLARESFSLRQMVTLCVKTLADPMGKVFYDGLPRSRIEDDHEYVARWKAAHGQDSMPWPLLDPLA
jgi:hypothetical protein